MLKRIFKMVTNLKRGNKEIMVKGKIKEESKGIKIINELEDMWLQNFIKDFIKKLIITILILLKDTKQNKEIGNVEKNKLN